MTRSASSTPALCTTELSVMWAEVSEPARARPICRQACESPKSATDKSVGELWLLPMYS